jgi:hypothetical protein
MMIINDKDVKGDAPRLPRVGGYVPPHHLYFPDGYAASCDPSRAAEPIKQRDRRMPLVRQSGPRMRLGCRPRVCGLRLSAHERDRLGHQHGPIVDCARPERNPLSHDAPRSGLEPLPRAFRH